MWLQAVSLEIDTTLGFFQFSVKKVHLLAILDEMYKK